MYGSARIPATVASGISAVLKLSLVKVPFPFAEYMTVLSVASLLISGFIGSESALSFNPSPSVS